MLLQNILCLTTKDDFSDDYIDQRNLPTEIIIERLKVLEIQKDYS